MPQPEPSRHSSGSTPMYDALTPLTPQLAIQALPANIHPSIAPNSAVQLQALSDSDLRINLVSSIRSEPTDPVAQRLDLPHTALVSIIPPCTDGPDARDALWEHGSVYVPSTVGGSKPWPHGMYARDMARAFALIGPKEDGKLVEQRCVGRATCEGVSMTQITDTSLL